MDGFGTPRRTIYFRVELARSALLDKRGAAHSLREPQMLDERLLCASSAGVSSWPRIWLDLRAGRSRRDVLDAARDFARESVLSTSTTPGVQRKRSGLPLLPIQGSGVVVDLPLVNQLRDELQ